jgi:hypothetical protein
MRSRSADHSITWFDAVPQIQLQKCVGNHLQDYTVTTDSGLLSVIVPHINSTKLSAFLFQLII